MKDIAEYLKIIKNASYRNKFIYGAGAYAKEMYRKFSYNNINIDGFVVTNKDLNPNYLNNIKVYGIDELQVDNEDTLFIICMKSKWNDEITKILHKHEYHNVIIAPEEIDIYADSINRFYRPTLEITPKIGCSVQCKYCPQELLCSTYFRKSSKKMMSFEEFKICIDKTPDNLIIEFAGFVEPFLNPEAIQMMIYADSIGRDISLYTTLVGLTEEKFNKIKDIPFFNVVLHVPDEEGYANIPLSNEYFNVLNAALNAKKSNGMPFIDSANCQSFPNHKVLKMTSGILKISYELMDRAGNLEGEQLAKKHSVKGKIKCSRAQNMDHFVLLPDGSLVLCCNDFGLKHIVGNLMEQSFDEVVNSEKMKSLYKCMEDDTYGEIICRNCIYAIEV